MNLPTLQFVKSVSERSLMISFLLVSVLFTAQANGPKDISGNDDVVLSAGDMESESEWSLGSILYDLPFYSNTQVEGLSPLSPPPDDITCPPNVVKNTITSACFASHSWSTPIPGAGNHLQLFFDGISEEHDLDENGLATNSGIFATGTTTVTFEEHDASHNLVSSCSFTS